MARDETSRAKARKQKLEEAIKIAGSAAKLSKLCGISASEISQMRNPDHPRNVGDVAAEKIETALSKTHGWMDQLHDEHEIVQNNHANERTITMDELEQQVLAIMKQQSPEQKEALLEIAKTLNKMS
jgi:DNA-directed RNA polymerase specialized sigma subunit